LAWNDTIAAIATPPGTGGLGVIRISGPRAEEIARGLFKPANKITAFESHRLYHGDIVASGSGTVLDEVLLVLMKQPRSYTGEDTLEVYCHGGQQILHSILEEAVALGCHPAEPGEFTKRAFLNSRLDLAQAEAISDLIAAPSSGGQQLALSHLKGRLSGKINDLRGEIIAALALLESTIDFAAEEISADQGVPATDVAAALTGIIRKLQDLLSTYDAGKIQRHGAQVVLAGKPNVGKSSLLNALLGEKRAIVTPLPGTTRDFIEEFINISGVPVKLTDTAGLRTPENPIEREGIALTRQKIDLADLVILILDGSEPLGDEDRRLLTDLAERPLLLAINKSDLPPALAEDEIRALKPAGEVLRISAKYSQGLGRLKEAISRAFCCSHGSGSTDVAISNIRHKNVLERTAALLSRAREGALDQLPAELVAIDIREALTTLGEIAGRTTDEELLQQIFSRFCIGK